MPKPEIVILKDASAVAHAAAERVREAGHRAAEARGAFHWVLAGGSTPRTTYEVLARDDALHWRTTHVYFGDERRVPPDHPESNYAMAEAALLHEPFVARDRVLRIRGELPLPEAVADYEARLRAAFPGREAPAFDLVLLGLGTDGHTASLFPGAPALGEQSRWVAPHATPVKGTERVTLTFPALNAAREVVFVVAGQDKARPLHALLEGHGSAAEIPARGVAPSAGTLTFLIDEAAAALLGP